MGKFCYSTDEEVFRPLDAENREGAIAEVLAMGLERAWIGEPCPLSEPEINVDAILDQLACEMDDDVGEVAEGWPDLSTEQQNAMGAELTAIMMKHLRSSGNWPTKFYSVQNIEEVTAK